jgi:hypothetical protein
VFPPRLLWQELLFSEMRLYHPGHITWEEALAQCPEMQKQVDDLKRQAEESSRKAGGQGAGEAEMKISP